MSSCEGWYKYISDEESSYPMDIGRDKFSMLYVICCCYQHIFFLCPILCIYWDTSVNLSHCRSVQQCDKEFRLGRFGLSGRITIRPVHVFCICWSNLSFEWDKYVLVLFRHVIEWSYKWRFGSSLQRCTKNHHCIQRECNFCNSLTINPAIWRLLMSADNI